MQGAGGLWGCFTSHSSEGGGGAHTHARTRARREVEEARAGR